MKAYTYIVAVLVVVALSHRIPQGILLLMLIKAGLTIVTPMPELLNVLGTRM